MKAIRLLAAAAVVAVLGFADVRSQEPQSESAPASEGLVLKTAETLEFDTNQVTWASLDVSPDGKTIVFDLLGDLYTLPIEGGTATRIIGGLSFESQPVYSPDGKTFASLAIAAGLRTSGSLMPTARPRAL
jgi:WD40-like Beta Propeller Repeat